MNLLRLDKLILKSHEVLSFLEKLQIGINKMIIPNYKPSPCRKEPPLI